LSRKRRKPFEAKTGRGRHDAAFKLDGDNRVKAQDKKAGHCEEDLSGKRRKNV
jgi:hypothetical protein